MPIWRRLLARGRRLSMLALLARAAETTNSSGVFTLARYVEVDQNSGEWKSVLRTTVMSPPLERYDFAMRSTRDCGGSSETKRTASLRLMNWAVAGLEASM